MPALSIIVPIYNTGKYLSECIESILNQDYRDYELILIDDGSCDNSGDICDMYAKKDRRIVCIHQTNKGVSNARNVGIAASTGKYLMFCDSDDTVVGNSLGKIMSYVLEKNYDITMCTYVLNFADAEITETIAFDESRHSDMCSIMCDYVSQIAPWSACRNIIKSELVKSNNIRYDENYSAAEDCDFYFMLCRFASRFGSINQPIIRYRTTRENSTSNTRNIVNVESISIVYDKWQNYFFTNYGMAAERILRFFSESYYYLIFDIVKHGDFRTLKICQMYRRILKYVKGRKKRIVVLCYNILGVENGIKLFRGKLRK